MIRQRSLWPLAAFLAVATNACSCGNKCKGVSCPELTACNSSDGLCYCGGVNGDAGKGTVVCGAGERCDGTLLTCVSSLCDERDGGLCSNGTTCDPADGQCKCGATLCAAGEQCEPLQHVCASSPACQGVACAGGEACDLRDGSCKCGGIACGSGELCLDAGCVVDACFGVSCSGQGNACYQGICRCGSSSGPTCNEEQFCDGTACRENSICADIACRQRHGLRRPRRTVPLRERRRSDLPGQLDLRAVSAGQRLATPAGRRGDAARRRAARALPGRRPVRGGAECGPGEVCNSADGQCLCGTLDGGAAPVKCAPNQLCGTSPAGVLGCETLCNPYGAPCPPLLPSAGGLDASVPQSCFYELSEAALLCEPTGQDSEGDPCGTQSDCKLTGYECAALPAVGRRGRGRWRWRCGAELPAAVRLLRRRPAGLQPGGSAVFPDRPDPCRWRQHRHRRLLAPAALGCWSAVMTGLTKGACSLSRWCRWWVSWPRGAPGQVLVPGSYAPAVDAEQPVPGATGDRLWLGEPHPSRLAMLP